MSEEDGQKPQQTPQQTPQQNPAETAPQQPAAAAAPAAEKPDTAAAKADSPSELFPPPYIFDPKNPRDPQEEPPDLADTAAKHIGAWINGNGLTVYDARVQNKNQQMLRMDIPVEITVTANISEETKPGKITEGTVCTSKADVKTRIEEMKKTDFTSVPVILQIGEALQKTPLMGWGAQQKVVLDGIGGSFVFHESCTRCKGNGRNDCPHCKGKRQIPCRICKGFGMMDCRICHRKGTVTNSAGAEVQCPECFGKMKAPCRDCRGLKNITCPQCRGSGQHGCRECEESGWQSAIGKITFDVLAKMQIDSTLLPPPVKTLLQGSGEKKLAEDRHAKIMMILPEAPSEAPAAAAQAQQPPPAQTEQTQQTGQAAQAAQAQTQTPAQISYRLEMPYATADYVIGGTRYPAEIAGYQSCIVKIGDFLDPLIKPGIDALQKIVKGPMATETLMKKAFKLRLIKDVFSHTGEAPKGRLLKNLKTEYPRGISDKYAKACIQFADQAVKALTDKPRQRGGVVGGALAGVAAALWFFADLRSYAVADAPENEQMLFDFGLAGLLAVGAYFSVRLFAANALKKILAFQGGNTGKQALPPAGNAGLIAAAAALALFLLMAWFAPERPGWL
ncbi:MAG: hypothetical protein EA357_00910 [Micavibrio sp.]|nr:MAG: hypothetical protein EA357_00910 [Micavibrio sp.]